MGTGREGCSDTDPGNEWPCVAIVREPLPKMHASKHRVPAHRNLLILSSFQKLANVSERWKITGKVTSFTDGMTERGLRGFLETRYHSIC